MSDLIRNTARRVADFCLGRRVENVEPVEALLREALAPLVRAGEAFEMLESHQWSATFDVDPNPRFHGWEITDADGGLLVFGHETLASAILAARAEQGGERSGAGEQEGGE